ncbi:MAG: methylmalonyl-CoA epimerase [bacterium]
MIQKINHLGIAVNNLDEQIPFYRDILKFNFLGIEEVSDQKVRVAIFQIGEVKIELLEPTDPDSPIAKYLDKKGAGIHHIAYQTDNIQHQIDELTNQNINMIDQQPRTGAHQTKIAFIHPKSSGKILIELCQPSE